MAKRFVDTEIWKRAWFRALSPKMKCAWIYLCTNCDHAGIWEIDLETMGYFIGQRISLEEITEAFKVIVFAEDKIFIPSFIAFQYGDLDDSCRPHLSVMKRLRSLGLWDEASNSYLTVSIQLGNSYLTVQDKDKDKDKEQDKDNKANYRFETQRAQQNKFKELCQIKGIETRLEFKVGNSRFDAVVFNRDAIAAIIEFKKYIGKEPRTDTAQLNRYREFGVPIFMVKRDHDLEDVVSEIFAYLTNGQQSKYIVEIQPTRARKTLAFPVEQVEAFDTFWQAFPNKVGKSYAKQIWANLKPPIADILTAVQKYKNHKLTKPGQDWQHPSTFLNHYRDCLEPDYGVAEASGGGSGESLADIVARKKREQDVHP